MGLNISNLWFVAIPAFFLVSSQGCGSNSIEKTDIDDLTKAHVDDGVQLGDSFIAPSTIDRINALAVSEDLASLLRDAVKLEYSEPEFFNTVDRSIAQIESGGEIEAREFLVFTKHVNPQVRSLSYSYIGLSRPNAPETVSLFSEAILNPVDADSTIELLKVVKSFWDPSAEVVKDLRGDLWSKAMKTSNEQWIDFYLALPTTDESNNKYLRGLESTESFVRRVSARCINPSILNNKKAEYVKRVTAFIDSRSSVDEKTGRRYSNWMKDESNMAPFEMSGLFDQTPSNKRKWPSRTNYSRWLILKDHNSNSYTITEFHFSGDEQRPQPLEILAPWESVDRIKLGPSKKSWIRFSASKKLSLIKPAYEPGQMPDSKLYDKQPTVVNLQTALKEELADHILLLSINKNFNREVLRLYLPETGLGLADILNTQHFARNENGFIARLVIDEKQVNDNSLAQIQHIHTLEEISFVQSSISTQGISKFAYAIPSLRKLEVHHDGNKNMNMERVRALAKKVQSERPKLRIVLSHGGD